MARGRLPDLNNDPRAEAVGESIGVALRDFAEHQAKSFEQIVKKYGDTNVRVLEQQRVQFERQFEKTLEKMFPRGKLQVTDEELEKAVEQFTAGQIKQDEFLKKFLADDARHAIIMEQTLNAFTGKINAIEQKTLQAAFRENIAERGERYAQFGRSRDEDEDFGRAQGLLGFLTQGGALAAIYKFADELSQLAVVLGGIGLVSMLSDPVKQFLGDWTATWTMLKQLSKVNLFGPIFDFLSKVPLLGALLKQFEGLRGIAEGFGKVFGYFFKIMESIPVLGRIVKMIPALSVILAAFEILPKVFARYKTDGWWGALEAGLQGLYDFFVKDVALIVARALDKISKWFGLDQYIDFTAFVETFSKGFERVIQDFVGLLQVIFTDGATAQQFEEKARKLLVSVSDTLVNSVLKFFKIDYEFSTEKFVTEVTRVFDEVLIPAVAAWVTSVEKGIAGVTQRVVDVAASWSKAVTDKWDELNAKANEAISAALWKVTATWNYASGLWASYWEKGKGMADEVLATAGGAWVSGSEKLKALPGELVDAFVTAFENAWSEALKSISDLGQKMQEMVDNLWRGIQTYLHIQATGVGLGWLFPLPGQEVRAPSVDKGFPPLPGTSQQNRGRIVLSQPSGGPQDVWLEWMKRVEREANTARGQRGLGRSQVIAPVTNRTDVRNNSYVSSRRSRAWGGTGPLESVK